MVLRDLSVGRETVLPIPQVESGWRTMFTRFNVFNPAGTKLALTSVEVQHQKDGRASGARSGMKVVIYDIPTGKLVATDLTGSMAMAKFDGTGRGLIVMKPGRRQLGLYTASLPKLEPKPLTVRGFLQSVCPTADVICVWAPPKRGPQRLSLFDMKADKELAELPVHPANRNLDDWETQWTADGRYLYYHDVEYDSAESPGGRRRNTRAMARIWDRQAGKMHGDVDLSVAIGPGPGPAMMVLAKRGPRGFSRLVLHDAKTGRDWLLGDDDVRAIHAWGKNVLYAKPLPDGAEAAYVAEIRMPAGR